ncbi:Pxr1, partial [Ophiophagus hannah]
MGLSGSYPWLHLLLFQASTSTHLPPAFFHDWLFPSLCPDQWASTPLSHGKLQEAPFHLSSPILSLPNVTACLDVFSLTTPLAAFYPAAAGSPYLILPPRHQMGKQLCSCTCCCDILPGCHLHVSPSSAAAVKQNSFDWKGRGGGPYKDRGKEEGKGEKERERETEREGRDKKEKKEEKRKRKKKKKKKEREGKNKKEKRKTRERQKRKEEIMRKKEGGKGKKKERKKRGRKEGRRERKGRDKKKARKKRERQRKKERKKKERKKEEKGKKERKKERERGKKERKEGPQILALDEASEDALKQHSNPGLEGTSKPPGEARQGVTWSGRESQGRAGHGEERPGKAPLNMSDVELSMTTQPRLPSQPNDGTGHLLKTIQGLTTPLKYLTSPTIPSPPLNLPCHATYPSHCTCPSAAPFWCVQALPSTLPAKMELHLGLHRSHPALHFGLQSAGQGLCRLKWSSVLAGKVPGRA